MTKTGDPARLASIKMMVAGGMNADELEELSDREVQDRFNIFLNVPRLKRTRLDSATEFRRDVDLTPATTPLTKKDSAMFNRDEAIAEISRRCPNSDTASKSFLKTKSDEYLAARLAAMDRSDVRADVKTEARADLRGHEPQIARYDGYGRIIPGTLRLDAEARTDAAREDAAYRKSVQNLNAWRGDDRLAPSGAPSGAPIESRWKADAAEIDADRARADAAYERGKANLNRRDR